MICFVPQSTHACFTQQVKLFLKGIGTEVGPRPLIQVDL